MFLLAPSSNLFDIILVYTLDQYIKTMSGAAELTQVSQTKCHGGFVRFYKHESSETKTPMTFAVYLPPKAVGFEPVKCPVVYWLSGLTCTEQNFITKAGTI